MIIKDKIPNYLYILCKYTLERLLREGHRARWVEINPGCSASYLSGAKMCNKQIEDEPERERGVS